MSGVIVSGVVTPLGMVMVMVMGVFVVVFVTVVPQFSLVQQKEKDQAHQQGNEQGFGANAAFESLWQKVHESRGQQGTGRQTQQMLGKTPHQGHAQ